MKQRIHINEIQPAAYKAMYALVTYLAKTELSPIEKELIKVRASQINGCVFCLDMHMKEAIQAGETVQRLVLLDAWKECSLFNEREKVLLQMTEEITLIHRKGLSDGTYEEALQHFSEVAIAQIIMAVVTINAWNRIAISTRLPIPA